MSRRTLLTLSTAAFLCGMYALYGVVVSPLVSPNAELLTERTVAAADVPRTPPENRQQAEEYLSEHPWAAEAKYKIRNEQSYVYFEECETTERTGRVRFKPFAMIWRQKDHDPKNAPITIVCEEAVMDFSEKFDIASANLGRIVAGVLKREVTIRGPEGMAVDGRDFIFSEESLRVWSDNPVRFRYGPHSGTGHGVELALIPDSGPHDDEKPAVAGVRTVRLIKDVVMDLVSQDRGETRETVHITSEGSFEYGVEARVATFQKAVRVDRPTGPVQFDRLRCETLTIVFEREQPTNENPGGQQGERRENLGLPGGDMQFRRLRAEGPNTTVTSDRSGMQARMQELTYDAEARVVALRDGKQVRMIQRNNEIFCPEVTAMLDEEGEIVQATCRGAGKLFSYAKASEPAAARRRPIEFAAEWLKELRMEPDRSNGLDLIELTGRAILSQPERMGLQADVVRLWVTADSDRKRNQGIAAPAGGGDDPGARPRRMLALGNTIFASPQITGKTERLEVWFEEGTLPVRTDDDEDESEPRQSLYRPGGPDAARRVARRPPAPDRGRGETNRGLEIATPVSARRSPSDEADTLSHRPAKHASNPRAVPLQEGVRMASDPAPGTQLRHAAAPPSSRRGFADVADPPVARKAPPRAEPPRKRPSAAQKPPDNPLHVVADRIRVKTMMNGDDPQVAEVDTEGRVHVTQDRGNGATFDLTGDDLHLVNYSEKDQVIHVVGKPAQIRDRDMKLEGANVHLDTGRNRAWVNGAGVLGLPVRNGFDGKELAQPQSLDIFWKERMDFDGQVARFFAKVRTRHSGSEVECEEMHVMLDQRISFTSAADRADSPEARVRFVVCRDGVDLKSHEYVDNRLSQIRVARGFEFTLEQTTGNVSAQGPGTLILWRRREGNQSGLAGLAGARANGPLETESAEWEYTRVDFSGRMDGNVERHTTTFHDRVRVVYGPVVRATDVVDADALPRNGGWLRCEELELTQNPQRGTQEGTIAVVGRGNAELEGRSDHGLFHAKAASVSYEQSKGLFILAGDGKRDATLWREQRVGKDRSSFEAQRMEFIPASDIVKVDRASGAQGGR